MRQQIPARKTLKRLLLFSIIVSSILFSCKKFDTTPLYRQGLNFEEKFFVTKNTPSKEVADLIEKLKQENKRNAFVTKLPDNCGLPLWDKLVFPKKARAQSFGEDGSINTDNVFIPLTSNGYSISTIITGEKINDTSYQLKWFTANDLNNLCHSLTDANIKKAESLLSLFIYMESTVFDRTDFYHIPKALFPTIAGVSQTDSTKHIKIKHKEISADTDQQTQSLVYWSCYYIPSGVCNCSGACDWRNPCPTMYCTATYCVQVEENPCPTCGGGGGTGGGGTGGGGTGGGGTGGGGGGTGGGGGNCGQVFYLVDPCGPPPPPPPPPPQDTILNPCLDIALLQNSASFISYMQELKDSTNSNREYAYLMFKDNAGVFGNTPHGLIAGPENHLSLGDFNNSYMLDCIAHSHFNTNTDSTRGLSIFSPDDLWSMCEIFNRGNVNNSSSFSFALVTKSGTQYLLKIENLTKFRIWAQKFTEGNFRLFKEAYKGPGIGIKESNTNGENEKKFLLYLQGNSGSGLRVFTGNSSFTNWNRLSLDSNNNVITVPCVENLNFTKHN